MSEATPPPTEPLGDPSSPEAPPGVGEASAADASDEATPAAVVPAADPNARSELGRTPVPGPNPAGEPANDEPDFETLRDEATKDVVQGPPDWELVGRLGTQLLREKSKDFVVASYTGVALTHSEGAAGLADALSILDGLINTYWETGSPPIPKRMRARANAINWFGEKAGAIFERSEFKPADREKLESGLEAANSFMEVASEKFGEFDVGLGPLLAGLRDATRRLEVETEASRPAPSPSRPASSPSAPAAAVSGTSAAALPGEITSRGDAETLVNRVASFMRSTSRASPEGYALPRVMAWGPLRQAPPAEDGNTLMPPPEQRSAIEQAAGGAPDDLLGVVEAAFVESPMWLDLQRHAAQACEQLGGEYRAVGNSIVALTRDLVERIPSLPTLGFNDGSPLADELTRQWLAEQVLGGEGGGAAMTSAPVSMSIDAGALAELRRDCQPLVKKGRLAEVEARLRELFAEANTPRDRFQERLEFATLCFEGGKERVALALLDGLDAVTSDHELDRWDPALAARVLQALYRTHVKVLGKKDLTPEQTARRDEVFDRLCRLEPSMAVAVE